MENGAIVRWSGDDSWFVAAIPGGHEIDIDEPEPIGRNHGGGPTDLLLAAAASCSGISATGLFKKMRQPVSALTVVASGERQAYWPKAFTSIMLRFEITVESSHNPELLRKAVDLAVRKYCPVSGTIELGQGGCRVDYEIAVSQES